MMRNITCQTVCYSVYSFRVFGLNVKHCAVKIFDEFDNDYDDDNRVY